jgi:hypothetical protein
MRIDGTRVIRIVRITKDFLYNKIINLYCLGGIPVRPVIRAGLSARRGNEGEAIRGDEEWCGSTGN